MLLKQRIIKIILILYLLWIHYCCFTFCQLCCFLPSYTGISPLLHQKLPDKLKTDLPKLPNCRMPTKMPILDPQPLVPGRSPPPTRWYQGSGIERSACIKFLFSISTVSAQPLHILLSATVSFYLLFPLHLFSSSGSISSGNSNCRVNTCSGLSESHSLPHYLSIIHSQNCSVTPFNSLHP